MDDLDLRRLRVLRELAHRGTLHAVATALGYSPSAVSQQLAVLEREVGVPLLTKAGRGVTLTEAAHLLVAHADVLLDAAAAARADLAALDGEVRGAVRVGGLQSATRRLLIPTMVDLGPRHPRLRVHLSEIELEQALPDLRLGALDLAISDEYDGHTRPRPAGLRFTLLLEEDILLALPTDHPAARPGTPVPMTELRDAVWAASEVGTGHLAMVTGTCRSLGGFEPDVRHHSNDADVQADLVRRTGAVALLPTLAVPADAGPDLALRPVAGAAVRRRLVTVTRDGTPSPALHAFATSLHERARSVTGSVPDGFDPKSPRRLNPAPGRP